MRTLPFDVRSDEFVEIVRHNKVTILAGETGSGKSSRAPLALLQAGLANGRQIVVTEPRRPAATMLARWVAQSHGTPLGQTVGYQIGQDRQAPAGCKLIYMTEGILLNQLHGDRSLGRYSIIMIDEAHERGINQDVLLAMVKQLVARRDDVRVVIMSATIDVDRFSNYFGGAPIFQVDGRTFPVTFLYETGDDDDGVDERVDECVERIIGLLVGATSGLDVHDEHARKRSLTKEQCRGEILCFMPDQAAIHRTLKLVEKWLDKKAPHLLASTRLCPLFGQMPEDDKDEVLTPDHRRRVIVATNIAETSLTIDGIVHVVDSGLIKMEVYQGPSMTALQVVDHSQAGVDQRAGRAGRTQAGFCHRMFTRHNYERRDAFTEPEIKRVGLNQTLLNLRCIGFSFEEILELDWLDPPLREQWMDSRKRLQVLGALDKDGNVTEDGRRMYVLHIEPMTAKMILQGERLGCLNSILTVAAVMSVTKNIFNRPEVKKDEADAAHEQFKVEGSDPLTALNVYEVWLASGEDRRWAHDNFLSSMALDGITRLRHQFARAFTHMGEIPEMTDKTHETILKAIAAGLIVNVAFRRGKTFAFEWKGMETYIFPGSAAFSDNTSDTLVCAKVIGSVGEKGPKTWLRAVQVIPREWIAELIPEHVRVRHLRLDHEYDLDIGYVTRAYIDTTWDGTTLSSTQVDTWSEGHAIDLADRLIKDLSDYVHAKGIHPELTTLRSFWNEVLVELGVATKSPYSKPEVRDHDAVNELKDKLRQALVQKLADVRSVEQFLQARLDVSEDIFFTPEQMAARVERLAEREREHAEFLERERDRRALYMEKLVRRAIEADHRRAADEVVRAPLREKVVEFDQRLVDLGVHFARDFETKSYYNVQSQARSATARDSYFALAEVSAKVEAYRLLVEREERKAEEKFAQTVEAHTLAIEQVPACPLCETPWDSTFRCEMPHDINRLIRIPQREQHYGVIGVCTTNKDDRVTELRYDAHNKAIYLHFLTPKDRPWTRKKFKRVDYDARMAILPKELAGDHDDIVEWLEEIETRRKALEQLQEETKRLSEAFANGGVLVLTFTKTNSAGFLVAEHQGVQYAATYDPPNPYPQMGQKWICKVTKSDTIRRIEAEAEPIKQIDGPASKSEIEAFEQEVQGLYDGLPSELFVN